MDSAASLTEFLETLSSSKLLGLYDNQWTCQAVFRSLPPLAKQYCLRLILLKEPLRNGKTVVLQRLKGKSVQLRWLLG